MTFPPTTDPPRYVPERLFPAYSYVSGRYPHPTSDPRGHSFGHVEPVPSSIDPDDWQRNETYLFGLDLFNHGYYWEAHEAWEALWHACGRGGLLGDFLKGLIKLAAAGVKAREGRPAGVERHARRAAQLWQQVAGLLAEGQTCVLGLDVEQLTAAADRIDREPLPDNAARTAPVQRVFTFVLRPQITTA